ncbi:diaphanous FH3 Domain, partial [Necator americanus]
MALRSELMRDGFGKYIPNIVLLSKTDERIREVYSAFTSIQDDDFNELVSRFETLRGEYETLGGCFELLVSTSANTAVEPVLLSILQHFMLIPEDVSIRLSYFRLIENCVSEIVLHKNGVDPDFDSQFRFETPVNEIIDQLQDAEFSRKLEQAVQAKQEAVAKQMQYWQKLDEFRKEATLLRKHIANPNEPIPPATTCTIQQPVDQAIPSTSRLLAVEAGSNSSSLPPITGGPSAPPPPPPPG